MPLYKTKPKTIEAIQYTLENGEEITKWTDYRAFEQRDARGPYLLLDVKVNSLVVNVNDWVIKISDDEFDTCYNENFGGLYEPVINKS